MVQRNFTNHNANDDYPTFAAMPIVNQEFFGQIRLLIRTELHAKSTYVGMVLYMVVTQYMAFQLLHNQIGNVIFIALFWIVQLFVALVISQRITMEMREGSALFNFLYGDAHGYIFSRIFFLFICLTALGVLSFSLMALLYGIWPSHPLIMVIVIAAGSFAFAALFGFTGGMGAGTDNAYVLAAVLGFPLVIPIVLLTTRLSLPAFNGIENITIFSQYFVSLLAMGLLVSALAYLLFPYLWRR
jgi:heme exporter protein B